jgi:hypothetical protein
MQILREPSNDILHDAGTLMVLGVDERGPFSEADCWLAAGRVLDTSEALGAARPSAGRRD